MTDNSQRPEGRGRGVSAVNMAIDDLNIAKEAISTIPVNPVFGSVAVLLTMIRVSSFSPVMRHSRLTHGQDTMANEQDYVDIGLSCADVCKALEREVGGKELDDVSKFVCDVIDQLTTWVERATYISYSSTYHELDRRTVEKIQEKVMKRSGRHGISRFFCSSDDKDAIATWKSDLDWILRVFDVCSLPSCLTVANYSIHRPSLSSTLIQVLPICARKYRKSARTLATRIGLYVTCILFVVFNSC